MNVKITEVSEELSEYIINNYEEKILRKIIASEYGYFLPYEQEEIYRISLYNKPEFNNLITKKIKEYLKNNETPMDNETALEGFVNFRLKDYKNRLAEIIGKAVQQFEVKREYETFIGLLRYFVDMQEPKYDKIHLIGKKDGAIEIFDNKKNKITGSIDPDALLDSIINIAPNKIYIHRIENFENEELINTIISIFNGKISICNHCSFCS